MQPEPATARDPTTSPCAHRDCPDSPIGADARLAEHLERLGFYTCTCESTEAERIEIETIIFAFRYEVGEDFATHGADAESVAAETCSDNQPRVFRNCIEHRQRI